jgi:hypothetical protein
MCAAIMLRTVGEYLDTTSHRSRGRLPALIGDLEFGQMISVA